MLHHCNVDRLVAMWQVLNPASYIPSTGTPNNYASFALPAGTVYPNTPLRPFLRTTNQWWDSNLARFPANMGYTYPEINDWSLNQAQSQANVRAAIIARYGPGAPLPRRQENGTEVEGPRKSWYATVSCRTNIAEKSFYVCLFFGEPPKDPKEWLSSEYLVNMMPVLVPDTTQVKTGTKRPDYMRTNMEYPLDDKLLQNDIYPLTPENVEPYLAEKLTWRIMTVRCTFFSWGCLLTKCSPTTKRSRSKTTIVSRSVSTMSMSPRLLTLRRSFQPTAKRLITLKLRKARPAVSTRSKLGQMGCLRL